MMPSKTSSRTARPPRTSRLSPAWLAPVLALAALAVLPACGEATPASKVASATQVTSADDGELRDVRSIHRSRCGNCHVRVEPGTRSRAQLNDAFTRHHKRVRMNDREWASMVDYLAADNGGPQASSGEAQASTR